MFGKMLRKYLRFYVQFLPFAFDICIPCKQSEGLGVAQSVDIAKANAIDIKGVEANRC